MQADSADNVRMWNAVDGQPDHQAKNASDAVGWGSKNTSQIEARRFCPLLGWELSGVRQRVARGHSIEVIFCLARLLFASRSFNRLVARTSAARSKGEFPAQIQNNPVKQLAVIA